MLAAASTALRAPAPRGAAAPRRGGAAVRAAAAAINPSIRKDEAKVGEGRLAKMSPGAQRSPGCSLSLTAPPPALAGRRHRRRL
jgi:hypothetical protein